LTCSVIDKFPHANSRKSGYLAREQLPLEESNFLASDAMRHTSMSTELKTAFDLEIKGKAPGRRATDPGVRLNPLPAKNTLLTIIFFSAVAAAILYWIFFPPAAPQVSESSPTPNTQATERN
jgi:hypothetical protein